MSRIFSVSRLAGVMEESGMQSTEFEYYESVSNSNTDEESAQERSDRQSKDAPNSGSEEVTDCLHYKGKKFEDLQLADLDGVVFKSIEEVDQFYSYYSLAIGFSIRKHKCDKNRAALISRRQLVCSREGQCTVRAPRKKPKIGNEQNPGKNDVSGHEKNKKRLPPSRRITRCNCEARLTVRLCQTRGVYYASEFVTKHNHQLARPEHVRFLRSHRKVLDHDIAQVTALRKVSVSTCRAYELLVHQAGGYEFVGFTIKDLYNRLDSERREIMVDGDGQAAISFMNLKASRDPHFYCFFQVDEQGRLANLFWRDSQSLTDYMRFGDVLIMDTTYKTNIYGQPLVVFVGVNNHRATVLFGCALLVNETEDTYKWVIASFISSMNGKKPISVITDGDPAMRNAVASLIPEARHRLCSWHIAKNVCQNIHDVDIQKDFFHLIYAGLTVDEWESAWNYMVTMNGLVTNNWVIGMYNKRNMWAEAFFREHFFGGVSSTQRCEGMHRNLKGGLGRYMRLYEILPRVDKTIARIRDRVLQDDCRSLNSDPLVGRHMRCMQEQISKKFTHDIFLLLKDQIDYESKFVVDGRDELPEPGCIVFSLTQYNKVQRRWAVTYFSNSSNPTFKCSCNLFESDGIPCCHIFSVMKALLMTTFPESLVMKRWTKDGGGLEMPTRNEGFPNNGVRIARYGEMMAECAQLCFAASFSDESYEETMVALRRMRITTNKFKVRPEESTDVDSHARHSNVIKDPVICKTKGSHSNPATTNDCAPMQSKGGRGCKICGMPGHNIRTCKAAARVSRNNRGTPGGSGASTCEANEFPTDPPHEDIYREQNVGVASQIQSSGLIHHSEEARTFDFFSGYDKHVNLD